MNDSTQQDSPFSRQRRMETVLLAATIAIAVSVRLAFIHQIIRFDEAQTFNRYVSQAPQELFHYSALNNHVFHSVLAWFSTSLFGSEPWALRLPALVAGIVAVWLTFVLCRRLSGGKGGHIAALGMAVFPFTVLFSTNARGYTMLICFVLLAALRILRMIQCEKPDTWLLAILTALGLWSNPGMAYPAAGLFLWLTAELYLRGDRPAHIAISIMLPASLKTISLTLLLYTPVLSQPTGFEDMLNNPVIQPKPVTEFLAGIAEHSTDVFNHMFRNVSFGAKLMLGVLAAISLMRLRGTTPSAARMVVAAFGGAGVLFLLKRSFPFVRNWIWMIPMLLITADAGLTLMMRRHRRILMGLSTTAAVAAAMFAHSLVERDLISRYWDTGRFPEVVPVVEFLAPRLTEHDTVISRVPHYEQVKYYLSQHQCVAKVNGAASPDGQIYIVCRGVNEPPPAYKGAREVFRTGRAIVYVQNRSAYADLYAVQLADRMP